MKKILTHLLTLAVLGCFSDNVMAQLVTSSADDGSDGTLRQEILDTPAGGEITFADGIALITLTGELVLDKELTISATEGADVTLDANQAGRIFTINAGPVTLNNLDLMNGLADDGGAIFIVGADLSINGCNISNSVANGATGSGGGIFVDAGATLTASNSSFSSNQANRAGGAIEDNSGAGLNIVLTNINFTANNAGVAPATAAPGNGGAIHITTAGEIQITNGSANQNIAAAEGGAFWNNAGTMTVDGTSFDGNIGSGDAADNGGGALFNNGGTMVVMNITADNNLADGAAGSGGAVLNNGGSLTVSASSFSGNSAQRAGGAIEDASAEGGVLTLTDNDFSENSVANSPGNGGAVHVGGPGDSNISGGTANDNTAGSEGGAFWNNTGTMTVDGTSFDGNIGSGDAADNGGGALFNNGGTMVVMNITADNNLADGAAGSGGAVLNNGGSLTVSASSFSGNSAQRAGGAIEDASAEGGVLTLTDNDFSENSVANSPGNGGAVHVGGPGDSNISGGTANDNTAGSEGGAFWNNTGTMTVDGTSFDGNIGSGDAADNGGGALFNNGGTMVVMNINADNNLADGAAGSGGALLSTAGSVTVSSSSFDGNAANRAGGAIEIVDGDFDFTDSQLTNNDVNGTAGTAAPGNGGAFHVTGMAGMISFTNATISGNAAANEGGGLWNQSGTLMNVTTSTISGNNAGNGGGVYNNSGLLDVMASTISGNSSSGLGGGLTNAPEGIVGINASTIAMNTASIDGGGVFSGSDTELKNTILAFNSAASGQDVSGSFTSNGYNLISEDDQNAFPETVTDLEGLDPDLGPLQNNGGDTETHALMDGSAGIDAGDPADMFEDQRGFALVGTRDIGAFENGNGLNPGNACENYVYYLVDHISPEDISDLYQVNVVDGNAEMTYVATCPDEVHIAYNEVDGLVYAIRKDDGAIKSLNPMDESPEYGDALQVDASFTQITQAVFSQDGKLLLGSSDTDIIYSVDVMNGNAVSVFDSYSPIEGGDLSFALDGSALFMATREGGGGLYSIIPDGIASDLFLASAPSVVTGLATMSSGNLLISANGNNALLVKAPNGSDLTSLPLFLDGEPFTLNDGDLTSGCADNNQPVVTTGCTGGSVLDYSPGLQKNGQPITDPERNDPSKALGDPQINNTLNFVSLGFGGSITLGFDGGAALNGPGDDILVVETTYGEIAGPESDFETYPESAEVFVSQDDINFFSVGVIFTDQAASFDIDAAGQGFVWISSVKIVDTTPSSSISGDAFDLDGISALNGCGPVQLFNEGGDCNATEVVEYLEGTALGGGMIAMNRTDADEALGQPERTDDLVFVSLGYGGSLTLGFGGSVLNNDGDDLEIVETTFYNNTCDSYAEFADVLVSMDGDEYFFVKTVCRDDAFVDISDAQGTPLLPFINFVRIVNNDGLSDTPDGFDVDGVVAIDNCEDGEIETPQLAEQALANEQLSELSSYPNPTNGISNTVFITARTGRTTVAVYDMNGRSVATLFNQEAQAGKEYRLNFDGTDLPNGVYIYRLTNNFETINEKFMIAK